MAGIRKSPRNNGELLARISGTLSQHLRRGDRVVVALSGGIDSVVLCDLLRRYCPRRGCELSALHINHRISPNAAHWVRFCRSLCRAWDIRLKVVAVSIAGGDLEAAARSARYRVFARQNGACVALAHHLDDQTETLLLQLLRGSGVRGLSAMPPARAEANVMLFRPLLEIPREEIEAYAGQRKLDWIDDESNTDVYFDRNFLRHDILPRIARRYPGYRTTLARAARHFAEGARLLDDLADIDLDEIKNGEGIPVARLRQLGLARSKNVLRHYLRQAGILAPNANRLEECVRQTLSARRDAQLAIDLGSHELRYFSGRVFAVEKGPRQLKDYRKAWHGESRLRLKELRGTLVLRRARGKGIDVARLGGNSVTVQLRRGGERLQPHPGRPRRSLKKLMQEAGIPPWRRAVLPLLYCGDALISVPGIGIDCAFQVAPGDKGIVPEWKEDAPLLGHVTAAAHSSLRWAHASLLSNESLPGHSKRGKRANRPSSVSAKPGAICEHRSCEQALDWENVGGAGQVLEKNPLDKRIATEKPRRKRDLNR